MVIQRNSNSATQTGLNNCVNWKLFPTKLNTLLSGSWSSKKKYWENISDQARFLLSYHIKEWGRSLFHFILSRENTLLIFPVLFLSPASLFIPVFVPKHGKKKSNFHRKLCHAKWKTFVLRRKNFRSQRTRWCLLKIELDKNATTRIKYLEIIEDGSILFKWFFISGKVFQVGPQ